jgi:RNA polymerase sigma factor (sigma-70 family)
VSWSRSELRERAGRAARGDDAALLELLAAALAGDRAGRELLFDVLAPTLRAAARGVLGKRAPSAIDDVVQQAQLRLLDNDLAALRRFTAERGALHGYVYVISSNLAKTWLSRDKPTLSLAPEGGPDEAIDPRLPDERLHLGDRVRKIRAAWDAQLAPRERFLAALVLLDGKEVAEAAKLAGVSPQTVSNALSKARKIAAEVPETNVDLPTV